MQDKTAMEISKELRLYIEAVAEEVVLEGKLFEKYKKYLPRFCQAEGIDYGTLEARLSDFFEIVEEWKNFHTKGNALMAKRLGVESYLTETFVENLLNKVEAEQKKKEEGDQDYQKEEEDKEDKDEQEAINEVEDTDPETTKEKKAYPTPVILLWTVLGVVSIAEIVTSGWCSVVPLFINAFIGILACEKMENKKLKLGFILRGGLTVVVAFLLTYYFHWWSLLLTPLVFSFVLTKDDIED